MEKAIKKAIEGGYDPEWNVNKTEEFPELYNRAFLDPLFWQSLGKAKHLDEMTYCRGCILGWGCDSCECGEDTEKEFMTWGELQQHKLLDHINAGKNINSFFEDLL